MKSRTKWEIPEFAAVGVLSAVGVIIVSGILSGIFRSINESVPTTAQAIGVDIESSSQWADPFLAVVLLVVMGICWWQVTGWSDAEDENADVRVHLQRGGMISRWTAIELIVVAIGSVAVLIGNIISTNEQAIANFAWPTDISVAGNSVAVLALVTVAMLIGWSFGLSPSGKLSE
jgi:hypothetical protein